METTALIYQRSKLYEKKCLQSMLIQDSSSTVLQLFPVRNPIGEGSFRFMRFLRIWKGSIEFQYFIGMMLQINNGFFTYKWYQQHEEEHIEEMVNMEVKIISMEVIKPSSSSTIQHKKPFNLSLLDQLIPSTYFPMILFYPKTNNATSTITKAHHLKKSLSEALNLYYPLFGRLKDNIFIDNFDQGVPFVEARVNSSMADFMKRLEIESLNHFLPLQPYTKDDPTAPISAFQVTSFSCGGMAVAWAASHKLIDGGSAKAFLSTWSAICRGDDPDGVIKPDFNQASTFFPPINPIPPNYVSTMEGLWFTEQNRITRRFVFDARAIAAIKAMAIGDDDDDDDQEGAAPIKVSRLEALSCFIWKACMAATKRIAGESPTNASIIIEAVSLRTRTEPPMSDASIGNMFWWATALSNPADESKLHDLVKLLNDSIASMDSNFTKSLQGEEGFEAISEYCNQLEELFSNETPDIFAFTSVCHCGFNTADFGWGEPSLFGLMGKVGPSFRNFTVFADTKYGNGIEAWITLDDEKMHILEQDPLFLAFASPNSKMISSML